jgi:hypothetical protein
MAVSMMVVTLGGAFIWLSYSFFTVPGAPTPASQRAQFPVEGILPGDTLWLVNFNLGREPRLRDVVFYRSQSAGDGAPDMLVGRIVGLPGESLQRRGPTMAVGGREPLSIGFDPGDDMPVKDGDVIPPGRYLVVCDTDSVPYPDSRTLGYIEQERIRQRVAMNISEYNRR